MDGTVESDAGLPETSVRADDPEHCGRDEHCDGHDQTDRPQHPSVVRRSVQLALRVVFAAAGDPTVRYYCENKNKYIGIPYSAVCPDVRSIAKKRSPPGATIRSEEIK